MKEEKDLVYLKHIFEAIGKVEEYLAGYSVEQNGFYAQSPHS